jgi:hypothetical protein
MKFFRRLLVTAVTAVVALVGLAAVSSLAQARHGRGVPLATIGFTAGQQPLGLNLIEVPYSNGQQPFLNAFKNGGGQPEPWLTNLNSKQNYVPYLGWTTAHCTSSTNCSTTHTNEESYLQVDSSSYPTSMTLSPIPSGGQVMNAVYATLLNGLSKPAGATQYYQGGYYTLSFNGGCTMYLNGDATGISSPTGGLTSGMISGMVITSTMGAGTNGTVQVNIPTPSTTGVRLWIEAVAGSGNYCTNISFVYTPWMTAFTYDGRAYPGYSNGQIFHPWFLDWLMQSPINTIRFMRMLNIDAEPFNGTAGNLCLTGPVSAGTTTATLGTCIFASSATYCWPAGATSLSLSTAWAGTTGTYTTTFVNGDSRSILYTNGSTTTGSFAALSFTSCSYTIAAVNYAGPTWTAPSGTWLLSFGGVGGTTYNQGSNTLMAATVGNGTLTFPGGGAPVAEPPFFFITLINNWSQRAKYTDAFWNTMRGVPYDVLGNLCNTVNSGNGSNCWINTYHMANAIPNYATGLANLFYNGTGDTSGLFSSGLNAANKFIPEIGNEDWNSASQNGAFVISQGGSVFGSDYRSGVSWRGSQIAILAQTIASVYGTQYGARVAPTFGSQYGNPGDSTGVMQAYDWVLLGNTAPWQMTQNGGAQSPTNPWLMTSLSIAPYSGNYTGWCAADFTELQAQSDGGLTMFFNAQYANPVYDARTSSNYSMSIGSACSPALPSGGWNGYAQAQIASTVSGIATITGATRTLPVTYYEMGYGYYSSNSTQETFYQNVLADSRASTLFTNYYAAMSAANSSATACQFDFASYQGTSGNFGLIQSVNQSLTPSVLSSTPPPWQGFMNSTL